ncbi:hypothetical protein GC1_00025 [Gluconobacter phage GC1]|uniref:Holin n=1 Tax=Gluconobacter phage GC1 TaxID=2047788 RepID=A0A2I5AR87_9VIRU|nr:hypothetical protein FDJ08_gp25 [Gluconobacter phage GC1]ATS92593.1 hypothetical protein GC1_00025 [Gluconobacter phage GC1]
MAVQNTTGQTVSTPVASVENLIANPKSVVGWLGLVASLATWGTGLVDESTGAMISDIGMTVVSALAIILPDVVKSR